MHSIAATGATPCLCRVRHPPRVEAAARARLAPVHHLLGRAADGRGIAMCGRFTQHYTWAEVHAFLSVVGSPRNLRPRYNIAPTTTVDVVRLGEQGRVMVPMRWGLIPGWWKKSAREVPSTFNARAESVATKPMLRSAFKSRRASSRRAGSSSGRGRWGTGSRISSPPPTARLCWRWPAFGTAGALPRRARTRCLVPSSSRTRAPGCQAITIACRRCWGRRTSRPGSTVGQGSRC